MYKLIALDLDGTLLNSKKQISKENMEAIRLAESKGIKVVFCSGRIYAGARIYAEEASIKDPLIACNGAVIRDVYTGETIYNNTLNDEDCYKVIDMCHMEDIYFHFYIGDTMYTEKLEFSSLSYWKKNEQLPEKDRVDIRLVENMTETLEKCKIKASKIVIVSRDIEKLKRVRKMISGIETIDVMSSNFDNFEIVNRGVSKGNALKILTEKLNISMIEIAAIGDNENDYSMLREAGLSIAMRNAENSLKEISDFVTLSNDENGVAKAINDYILNKNI